MGEHGAPETSPLARFELDTSAERQASMLRGVAGALLMVVALWGLLVPQWLTRVTSLLALGFGALWIARSAAQRRRALRPEAHFLELWPDRIVFGDPTSGWLLHLEDVAGIELDEDALVVRLHLRDGEPRVLEPCYRGIALYELHQALADQFRGFQDGVRKPPG